MDFLVNSTANIIPKKLFVNFHSTIYSTLYQLKEANPY